MTRASDQALIRQVLAAYREGWFPMADPVSGQVEWVQPHRRSVIHLDKPDGVRISRSLRAKVLRGPFHITTDTAFEAVIRACAAPSDFQGRESTWLDPAIIEVFITLHRAGHAHSIEVWRAASSIGESRPSSPHPHEPVLVGGLYGLALGSAFMGESMFCRPDLGGTDASKVALVHLFHHLRRRGFTLLDTQLQNPHMKRLGAVEIARATYLKRLTVAADQPRNWLPFEPHQHALDLTASRSEQP